MILIFINFSYIKTATGCKKNISSKEKQDIVKLLTNRNTTLEITRFNVLSKKEYFKRLTREQQQKTTVFKNTIKNDFDKT